MKMSFDDYSDKKLKMMKSLEHREEHYSPKIIKKVQRVSKDNQNIIQPDKLENLKDENLHLKKKQVDLVSEIKVISTQLRRMTERLKSDKIMPGKSAQFEKDLDYLIEEQVNLKDQKLELMKKVKIAQKKLENLDQLNGNSTHKLTEPAFNISKF